MWPWVMMIRSTSASVDRFAECRWRTRCKPGQQLLVGLAKAAAGVDDRRRPGLKQQVDVDRQAGKGFARDAVDARTCGAFEAANFGKDAAGFDRHAYSFGTIVESRRLANCPLASTGVTNVGPL